MTKSEGVWGFWTCIWVQNCKQSYGAQSPVTFAVHWEAPGVEKYHPAWRETP